MKKKVLHILATSGYSGAENIAITIIKHLSEKYEFAYASPQGMIEEKLDHEGVQYLPIKRVSIREIRRLCNLWKPDIVHAHDFRASCCSAWALLNIPVVSHIHNNPLWLKQIGLNSLSYLLATCRLNKILCVSSAVRDEFLFRKVIAKKTVVLGNAVDLSRVKEMADEFDGKEVYDIGYFGRLAPQKDPLRFIEIIRSVIENKPTVKICMVGDGPLINECKLKIEQSDLSSFVTLLGFQENPYTIMKNTKMIMMPSLWEGFGLVAVEAMSLGKPVIAAPVGGLIQLIDETSGFLCETTECFVSRAMQLLESEDLYCGMSQRAKERAVELTDLDGYMNIMSETYKNL